MQVAWDTMRKYYDRGAEGGQIPNADWEIINRNRADYIVDLELEMLQIQGQYPGGDKQSARLLAHFVLGVGFSS